MKKINYKRLITSLVAIFLVVAFLLPVALTTTVQAAGSSFMGSYERDALEQADYDSLRKQLEMEQEISIWASEVTDWVRESKRDKKMQEFVQANVKEDLKPLHKFDIMKINREDFVLNDTIRYSHNLMANYITSGMKEVALKLYPDLDAIGIPSTIFRNGLLSHEKRTTINNIDYLKIFDGINATIADLKVGTIRGAELYGLVLENVLNNLKSKSQSSTTKSRYSPMYGKNKMK